MTHPDFEGTLVLEKMAEIGKVDEFFEAIDSDDFRQVKLLMRQAGLDAGSIAQVLQKMEEANGEH